MRKNVNICEKSELFTSFMSFYPEWRVNFDYERCQRFGVIGQLILTMEATK